ncbi:TerB family tellurite resistance protein [Cohnella terricola]|uniref:TerB family tellurite resistance protein n=1 Tax=Cohnella terricola TaxID=1289167 RepID=A0A559JC09_9BACL|nr:TerB family tellurite resistance protein [Cohnella terricola]TVX97405.1 TerB family tellurite resistance protein [Cohnella terricola]
MFLHFIQEREHREAFLELAHAVANADGFVSGNEKRYLQAVRTELGLEDHLRVVPRHRELSEVLSGIQDQRVQHLFFLEILLLAYADGDYCDEEKQIVMDMKRMFGVPDETYEAFKSWAIAYDQLKTQGMQLILNPIE